VDKALICPRCGAHVAHHRNPFPTVDIIIRCRNENEEDHAGVLLVERRQAPHGWALPGGFVVYGETLEEAAFREAREETGLEVEGLKQFHAYSEPNRDPRQHNISVVFLARARGRPVPGDDAQHCEIFPFGAWPRPLAFDHEKILQDYLVYLGSGRCPG
jgi:8-oxo-dGTP diphosphatase